MRATTTKARPAGRTGKRKPSGATRAGVRWYVRVLRGLAALVALAALAVFGYWAYRFTLTPVSDPHGWAVGNTSPGHTLRFYLDRPSIRDMIVQLGGNLLLLAPLGILLPMISRRLRGVIRLTLLVALISLTIETIQGTLIEGRAFDVDDIILNTLGATLVYLLIGRRVSILTRGRAS